MGINIAITIDVDNDGVERGERNNLTWESVAWVSEIKAGLSSRNLTATWFVRADNQLYDIYGSSAYLLLEHKKLWQQLEASGDEIAWHPHITEWNDNQKRYTADIDGPRCSLKLKQIRQNLLDEGFNHPSVRIGEGFHSNETMKTLSELGLSVDATAIPGRLKQDESRWFDWSPTPNEPYRPSRSDYRIPNPGSCWNILEVPMTTALIKASYDNAPVYRYLNPAYHHEIFKSVIDRLLDSYGSNPGEHFLVLILHPDEVLPRPAQHALYSFSLEEVNINLAYLLSALDKRELAAQSVRIDQIPAIWSMPQN